MLALQVHKAAWISKLADSSGSGKVVPQPAHPGRYGGHWGWLEAAGRVGVQVICIVCAEDPLCYSARNAVRTRAASVGTWVSMACCFERGWHGPAAVLWSRGRRFGAGGAGLGRLCSVSASVPCVAARCGPRHPWAARRPRVRRLAALVPVGRGRDLFRRPDSPCRRETRAGAHEDFPRPRGHHRASHVRPQRETTAIPVCVTAGAKHASHLEETRTSTAGCRNIPGCARRRRIAGLPRGPLPFPVYL